MNKEALLEQMPRVKNPFIEFPTIGLAFERAIESGKRYGFEKGIEAKGRADAQWIVEQGLVRLPSEEEMETILVGLGLLSKISYPTARRELSIKLLELMRERG